MIAETMLPAAPVTTNDRVGAELGIPPSASRAPSSARAGNGTSRKADAAAQAVDAADLDAAGVAQGLLDQQVGHGRGLAAGGEVDGLDQGVGALLLVGLGEAGDRAAER